MLGRLTLATPSGSIGLLAILLREFEAVGNWRVVVGGPGESPNDSQAIDVSNA